MTKALRFSVNGQPVSLDDGEDRTLLWFLRTDLALTGTKYGCGAGVCGSCTVVAGGRAVRSCQTRLKDVAGQQITTIEGLARDGALDRLQKAFLEHGGFQCGFCTPGMLMSAHALLLKTPQPSREAIVREMDDNLCRCGAHPRILAAIEAAARDQGEGR
jgi:aerobic-type carbon monoxide dehydrogenase small subunit (CoxS/CutS family)